MKINRTIITIKKDTVSTTTLMKEYCRIMDIAIQYSTQKWTEKEREMLPIIEAELYSRGEKLPSY